MTKEHCEYCQDGTACVVFVFADDDTQEVYYADFCPMCGRRLLPYVRQAFGVTEVRKDDDIF